MGERLTPRELKAEHEALRRGTEFVAYRDEHGERRLLDLGVLDRNVTVGRSASCDVWLDWDAEVSGLHAELERLGEHWVLVDDGSRNGTWVNGERLSGRRRLRDGDRVRCGRTVLEFRVPAAAASRTAVSDENPTPPQLSPAQRRVLVALCRPLVGAAFPAVASNQEIADELVLTVDAVKSHLRALFDRFELPDLPQNRKRLRLAELAFERGAVGAADFEQRSARGIA